MSADAPEDAQQATDAWFIRMRHGSAGRNFAQELWARREVGILFGTWNADELLEGGGFDETKWQRLAKAGKLPPERFIRHRTAKGHVKRFVEAKPGDLVFWSDAATLHWGRLEGTKVYDSELEQPCTTEHWGEDSARVGPVKARRIAPESIRRANLAELPAVFRLFRLTGRGTFQKMDAYAPWAHALAMHEADGLDQYLAGLDWNDWMGLLTPGGWEALVAEYLRAERDARSLAVSDGRTLPGVDLVMFLPGVEDRPPTRLLVQCKNDSKLWTGRALENWLRDTFEETTDGDGPLETVVPTDQEVVLANRGGFRADAVRIAEGIPTLNLLHGEHVEAWLTKLKAGGGKTDLAWMDAIRKW